MQEDERWSSADFRCNVNIRMQSKRRMETPIVRSPREVAPHDGIVGEHIPISGALLRGQEVEWWWVCPRRRRRHDAAKTSPASRCDTVWSRSLGGAEAPPHYPPRLHLETNLPPPPLICPPAQTPSPISNLERVARALPKIPRLQLPHFPPFRFPSRLRHPRHGERLAFRTAWATGWAACQTWLA